MYAPLPRNGADNKAFLAGASPPNKRLLSRPPTPAGDGYSYSTTLRRDDQSPTKAYPPPPHHQHHHSLHHSYAHTQKATTPSARFSVLPSEEALRQLSTSAERGLDSSVVPAIRQLSGANEFHVGSKESAWSKFGKQFYESPLILLLLGSAVVSAIFGNYDDAFSIALAIFIVVSVGFVQERRSEKSLEALNKLVPHYCHLIRDGQRRTELANVLVPGDIVYFGVGDRVPADVRLLTAHDLEVDQSTLTGETEPARKSSATVDGLAGHDPDIGERTNTVFMGTLVRNGRGSGVVVATGDTTEFGVVFAMMQEVEDRKTPLQLSMDELAQKLSAISFGVIGVICLIGLYQRRNWLEMFTIGVSLAVAAIPEGLPIVVTVTLALGVLRMSKRKAIVKKLPSVETLGSVSVICSDKTGTLTTNQMTVTKLYSVDDDVVDASLPLPPATLSTALQQVALTGNLCSHAFRNKEGQLIGQATEVALLDVLTPLGLRDERPNHSRTSEVPFNSEQKWQSVTGSHAHAPSESVTYLTGALDAVLLRCRTYLRADGSPTPLDTSLRSIVSHKAMELGTRGLRVVAMAMGASEETLSFAGFVGMLDPPRRGVAEAVASLGAAGVQVVMITGDAEPTAVAIARDLGLRVMGQGHLNVLTGKDIDALSQRQLTERIAGVTVFARTTPRHKMAIIEAYQARGAVVAMTGDGVNDAPALKMADIGVSMGKGGTDVAKEAADVILVDDNFATILSAVEEGKCIFYNIQNFLCFQLSTAVAALSLITLSTALRLPNPLNAMQILFINILMDGPPSQSLGVDPVNRDVMKRAPRAKNAPVLTRRLLYRILFSASMIVLGTLFIYAHELGGSGTVEDLRRDQTMTFTCFVFLDLISAVQNRGLSCGLTQNRMLVLTCSTSFIAQLLLVYFPPLQAVFQTTALSVRDLGVLLSLGAVSGMLHEARRRVERQQDALQRWEDDAV